MSRVDTHRGRSVRWNVHVCRLMDDWFFTLVNRTVNNYYHIVELHSLKVGKRSDVQHCIVLQPISNRFPLSSFLSVISILFVDCALSSGPVTADSWYVDSVTVCDLTLSLGLLIMIYYCKLSWINFKTHYNLINLVLKDNLCMFILLGVEEFLKRELCEPIRIVM